MGIEEISSNEEGSKGMATDKVKALSNVSNDVDERRPRRDCMKL